MWVKAGRVKVVGWSAGSDQDLSVGVGVCMSMSDSTVVGWMLVYRLAKKKGRGGSGNQGPK